MKFEKRADGGEVTPASSETPETGKKPVIIYILILFLAAFLLMFLSMLSHQRSNTEALGQLQNSVSAIQEIQATQEQIIELQKRLDETEAERDEAKEELRSFPTASPIWRKRLRRCWPSTIFSRSISPEIWTAAS